MQRAACLRPPFGSFSPVLLLFATLWAVTAPSTAFAHPYYRDAVPNGYDVDCVTCHTHACGGYGTKSSGTVCATDYDATRVCNNGGSLASSCLNQFGLAFRNGPNGNPYDSDDHVWSAWLASLDSDGDGYTNGRELGDATGTWVAGSADPSLTATSPGFGNGWYICNRTTWLNASGGAFYSPSDPITQTVAADPGCNGARAMFDLDDCSLGIDLCDDSPAAWCTNLVKAPSTGTSYTCACPTGYTNAGFPSGSVCNDVDECTQDPSRCGAGGTCNNTAGGFTCTCPAGYAFNGTTCVQDACTMNTDDCNDPQETCTPNGATGWTCGCNPGYQQATKVCQWSFFWNGQWLCLDWDYQCNEIDECALNTDDCSINATCTNTPGSFTCQCHPGYLGNGVSCTDLDECSENLDNCSDNAICTNLGGTFACACLDGYTGDGVTCENVNECSGPNPCHVNANCIDLSGSFLCACKPGYQGTGYNCTDIDECVTSNGECAPNSTCVNLPGAPRLCECDPGYSRETGADTEPCLVRCGDGELGPRERCDDGNVAGGDGCSPTCRIEPGWSCYEPTNGMSTCQETCGDGVIDPPYEECDLGASNSDVAADTCRTTCKAARCGDGVVDANETCDAGDGNSDTAPDACRRSCVPAHCGDGVIDTALGELCDPGGEVVLDARICARRKCQGGGEAKGGCSVRAPGTSPDAALGIVLLGFAGLTLARRRARRSR